MSEPTAEPTSAPPGESADPTTGAASEVSSRRRWMGRVALLIFLVGGMFLWRQHEPLDVYIGFDVGPTMRADDGGPARREELRSMRARVLDGAGIERALVHVDLGDGLRGPVTPAVVVRVTRGRYAIDLQLTALGGRKLSRAVALDVSEPGYQRIDLDR